MIDLHALREDTQRTLARITKKDPSFDGKKLLELDQKVRSFKTLLDELRSKKNELARSVRGPISDEIRQESKRLSDEIETVEKQLQTVEADFNYLYLRCPNIPLDEVPEGNKESNKVVKTVGEMPKFSFEPKNHVELAKQHDWIDFEAAARMTGNNFALYKGKGVTLLYSLALYMLKNNIAHGFEPVLPPYLVTEKSLIGSSNLPRFADQLYTIPEDNLYLTPTAEVNLANMYRDAILEADELPIRMTSWTSCFRREAGGYGSTERGLIRIHQFEKIELYSLTSPEQSNNELDRMIACAEKILQDLGLHYRISLLAGQDCSFASAKTYDIEVYMPGQKEYKEVSSASNCTDFQSRRCSIRYRPQPGAKPHLIHTLNASSLALPRLMVALLETYQQEDGSIAFPDVLKSVCIGV